MKERVAALVLLYITGLLYLVVRVSELARRGR
jgi:hypothetical protein